MIINIATYIKSRLRVHNKEKDELLIATINITSS